MQFALLQANYYEPQANRSPHFFLNFYSLGVSDTHKLNQQSLSNGILYLQLLIVELKTFLF